MTPNHFRKYGTLTLRVGDIVIASSSEVKVLGVYFDRHLTMSSQVNAIIKSCSFHLRNISKIRSFLTDSACRTAICSLVTSRLDYCASLLVGSTNYNIQRLQRLQNRAARILTRLPPSASITPVLHNLHWLPVELRIIFRMLVFVFKSIHGIGPEYLNTLVTIYVPSRTLRSGSDHYKLVSSVLGRREARHSFQLFAPSVWNDLPYELRSKTDLGDFKGCLKTFLFRKCYD